MVTTTNKPRSRNRKTHPDRPKAEPLAQTDFRELDEITKELGIAHWDVLLVGDGSGSCWSRPCGWMGVLIDRVGRQRTAFWGGMSHGTSAVAELMPYLEALLWYTSPHGPGPAAQAAARQRDAKRVALNIHILCDAKSIADTADNLLRGKRHVGALAANKPLWAAFREIEREGYLIHAHWVRREQLALNCLADAVSKLSRYAAHEHPYEEASRIVAGRIGAVELPKLRPEDMGVSELVYACNPDPRPEAPRLQVVSSDGPARVTPWRGVS